MPTFEEKPNIKFYSRESDNHICTLLIENDHLVVQYADQESYPRSYTTGDTYKEEKSQLESYFLDNLNKLESMKFKVLTGGKTKEGVLWDGEDTIGVECKFKRDFLFNLYIREIVRNVKKDILKMKYIITYEQTLGITICN